MRIVAGILTVGMLVAACGSDPDSESDTSTGLTEEEEVLVEELQELATDDEAALDEGLEQAAERSESAAGAAVAIDLSPCDLVTAEEIEAITGFAVELMSEEPPIDCRFDLVADSDLYVVTAVDDGQGRLGGPAAIFLRHQDESSESPFEPIENVGERALYAGRGLSVDAGGGRYFFIGVGGQYLELAEPLDHWPTSFEVVVPTLERLFVRCSASVRSAHSCAPCRSRHAGSRAGCRGQPFGRYRVGCGNLGE